MRSLYRALIIALCVANTATAARAQDVQVFDSAVEIAEQAAAICAAIVFDEQSFEAQLEGRSDWRSVDPRSTGSDLATHAWRSLTLNTTYIMRLPNGGCSFGIERGDGEAIRASVEAALAARGPLELVSQEPTRDGRAIRYAYCTRELNPRVMSIVAAERRSRPNFVLNLFRASSPQPSFCVSPPPA